VQWNFEKFVVSPQGEVVARFRQKTLPGASEVLDAIEKSREADRPIPTR
jgi:glutathione peroxidase